MCFSGMLCLRNTELSGNINQLIMKLLILCSIVVFVTSLSCTQTQNMTCFLNYDQSKYLEYRQRYFLTSDDQIIIKAVSPISLFASFIVIIFYYKIPAARQQPGDIILAIAISQIFLISSYLTTVIYNSYYPLSISDPPQFLALCEVTGYFIVLSFCAEFVYNISFCVFFIVIVKNVLKSWQKQKWIVHVICIVILVIIGIILFSTKQIGISLFGVCGLKVSNFSPFFRTTLIIIYFSGIIISSFYFKKHIPHFDSTYEKRKLFTKYYYRYIISISINLILQTTCDLIAAISCQNDHPSCVIRVAITLSNTFSILTPIIICSVMFTHPEVMSKVHSCLLSWLGENRKKRKRRANVSYVSDDISREVEMQETGLLANILYITKSRLIYSILCAIVIEDRQVTGLPNLRQVNDWNYKDKMLIKMNQEILRDFSDITLTTLNALDVDIISYCPRIFKTLMRSDGFTSIANFLSPKLNKSSIQKLSQADGGSSGQFFFFSSDNQIILKTLSKKQLDVLLSRLKSLVSHYQSHPNSLITKVYGLYTLHSKQTGEQYHLYVMKNLSGCDKKFILRTYDLKGSRFDRKVIKEYDTIDQHIKQTMKDLDFMRIEERLYIDHQQSTALKQILIQDSKFLKQNRLIDYSLIVMKMNISGYLQENQMLYEQFHSKLINPYAIIPSTKETGVAYVIGIIDYLQTWTAKKKGQKFTKVLLFFKFKSSEDVSAQAPEQYSDRFIKQVVNAIL